MTTSNQIVYPDIAARVEHSKKLLGRATVAAFGDLNLFSESIILTSMASKISGISGCSEKDLKAIGEDLVGFLDSVDEYCELIVQTARTSEAR